ncbi:MAG: hypothetical protein IJH34_13425, partial [Romboutsia sp.]|nr:hypothetical protein [Romboutsia sp.]
MKKNKKKIYTVLFACILLCIVIGGFIYCIRNSTKNILIRSLYNRVEYGEEFDNELLVSYNEKNIDRLNEGKELSAEDYFFIGYEYYAVKKDLPGGMKYIEAAEEKEGKFTNEFIKLFNYYLKEYYYTYIQKDDSIIEKIDNELNNMTIKDWNKYGLLLHSKLALYINFDGGLDYIMKAAEDMLKNEEKLDARVIVPLKDTLVSVYKEKGYHARVLEMSIETKALLDDYHIAYGDAYKARAVLNEAEVYAKLLDNDMAEKQLREVLDMDIENDILRRDIKVTALNKFIYICVNNGEMGKASDLIDEFKDIMNDDSNYNSDVLYYLSMAEYYIDKYEKDKSSKEYLSEAEKYIRLSKGSFLGYPGIRYVDIDLYEGAYETYVEYLKGNVDYALNKYNEILNKSTERDLKIFILEKICKICNEQKRYKEASEYEAKLLSVKNEESLLINKNYSVYTVEKYENELAIRQMNEEKIVAFIKVFSVILVLTLIIVVVVMKNRLLRKNNKIDGLTGINNRSYFDEIYNIKL